MTDKKPRKSRKKILKLINTPIPTEKQEWVNRQLKRMNNADRIAVLCVDTEGYFSSGWFNIDRVGDLLFMDACFHEEILNG